jgi:L-gulonate 5-dehydrogenase
VAFFTRMLSVVVSRPDTMSVVEGAPPGPSRGEVRVRMRHAGICGSDLHILHGSNPFVVYPRVIGHELFGIVDAVGEGVAAQRVDERVAIDPVVACGACYPCSIGRRNVCLKLQVIGVHRDGGFSEWMCAPSSNAHVVPSEITESDAALIEPFAVAANVTTRTGVHSNDLALVYGAGPVGLTVLQVLKGVHGVRVIVADRIDERLDLAHSCGADHTVNTAKEPLPDALRRLAIPDGPTLIIDAVCHPSILEEAVRIASPAARIGLLSFAAQPSAISQQEITRKELSLISSRLNSSMFPRVIEWMRQGRIHPERLVTHRVALRDIAKAVALIEGDPRKVCKVMLDIGEGTR